MPRRAKIDLPVHAIRRWLEPGPVVLVTSAWRGERNVMTLGWHTVMEFTPSLVGCMITAANHSFAMIRRSRECVINVPTSSLLDAVAKVGNSTGAEIDKFAAFGLTPEPADRVAAPLIRECHAAIECRLHDGRMIRDYNFFVFEAVKAHVARSPKWPELLHYVGDGTFRLSSRVTRRRRAFKSLNL